MGILKNYPPVYVTDPKCKFYMLFKEAFHIYSSFFETNKDEEALRDILLHPETGLNVVIVAHPVTLERFVVLNNPSCDVSTFLNHFTQEFLSGDEFLKAYPPLPFLFFKKTPPPFSLILKILPPPPHSKHCPPPPPP